MGPAAKLAGIQRAMVVFDDDQRVTSSDTPVSPSDWIKVIIFLNADVVDHAEDHCLGGHTTSTWVWESVPRPSGPPESPVLGGDRSRG